MNPVEVLREQIPLIEEQLHYVFQDKRLLVLSFIHCSFFNENRQMLDCDNERLEFLGDSVFGLIVSDYLYSHLPHETEGQLSHLRAHIVEASTCAQLLTQLGVAHYVLLGKGERANDGRGRETILADLFEALIGAIYMDGGLESAKRFFADHFSASISTLLARPLRNWKAELQDYSQKKYQKPPVYRLVRESGPDHSKTFEVVVMVGEADVAEGVGSSKKEAEQAAAQKAVSQLIL